MASGSYLLTGHDGPYAVERFVSRPGPRGWHYAATREHPRGGPVHGRVEVVVDEHGAAVRVHVEAAGWTLRGGVVGTRTLWRRGEHEHEEQAAGFTGTSPVWALAAACLLRGRAEPVRLRLVQLGDDALATRVVEQAWVRAGSWTPCRAHYDVTDLETGARSPVQVVDGVVLEAPGAALLDLADGPRPTV